MQHICEIILSLCNNLELTDFNRAYETIYTCHNIRRVALHGLL